MGEDAYAAKLAPLIAEFHQHWTFLGIIPDRELGCILPGLPLARFPVDQFDRFIRHGPGGSDEMWSSGGCE